MTPDVTWTAEDEAAVNKSIEEAKVYLPPGWEEEFKSMRMLPTTRKQGQVARPKFLKPLDQLERSALFKYKAEVLAASGNVGAPQAA